LSEFKKETKKLKEKVDTVDNVDKWANKIFDKATKIKPDKYKKPGMPESDDGYAGYTWKRGNFTYELHSDYSNTLIIKEAGKKDRSVVFGFDEIENKPYIIARDEQGRKYDDKAALKLAKQYVTQFKDALKIQN
jgi:hypothetical protein